MNALRLSCFLAGWPRAILFCLALQTIEYSEPAWAINILIDYRYDTIDADGFFDTQQKKDALQAAATRFSNIITETLSGASLTQVGNTDHRIGFTHPTTGADFEVSAASIDDNDSLAPPNCGSPDNNCYVANEYRGPWSILANQFIIYPGARPLPGSAIAEANSGTGLNWSTVFTSSTSHLNRGFRSSYSNNVPMWGGAISFDTAVSWHFNHTTTPTAGTTDLYSIALHEIGHLLGLATGWDEWESLIDPRPDHPDQFIGPNAIAAHNADNGTSLNWLNLVVGGNPHFRDGSHDSYIFQNQSPNLVGTVGTDGLQDLLMEPTANFTAAVKRFELTNVDVAALRDVGWSTVAQITTQPGDYNKNGIVDAADYVVFSKGLASGTYATWRANFGEGSPGVLTANLSHNALVPEPAAGLLSLISCYAIFASRRPSRRW
jgi:hypothetical protein